MVAMERVLYQLVEKAARYAKAFSHRRLFVVCGSRENSLRAATEICVFSRDFGVGNEVAYVGSVDGEEVEATKNFLVESLNMDFEVEVFPIPKVREMMGRTFDNLIIDAHADFPPNEVGICVETVRGLGFVVIACPPLEEWRNAKLVSHELLLTPPYSLEEVRNIYLRRVVTKLLSNPSVYVYDADSQRVLVEPSEPEPPKIRARPKPKPPKSAKFPKSLFRMALTQDQVEVLEKLQAMIERKGRKAFAIIADRGRGKSAALGIGIAGLSFVNYNTKGKPVKVAVTAPSYENASELFKFASKALSTLGVKHEFKEGFIDSRMCRIEYLSPVDVFGERCDYLVMDEAAGIYVPILLEYLEEFNHLIYATTTHGYEGTGRSFQVRLLPKLQQMFETHIVRMETPIRYGVGDPVEQWLYETFVLDAEPAKLSQRDLEDVERSNLVFEKLDLEKLFLGDDEDLRGFMGIYTFAHYRNNPRDLLLLADIPNQLAFAIRTASDHSIVGALHVAMEGGLAEDQIRVIEEHPSMPGNIFPTTMVGYYSFSEFAMQRGLRVVRIATHPSVMRQGIGTYALKMLERYALENGFSWVGAGFGANPELMRFWLKNGYKPFHVSPHRNKQTGEYTVFVIKPFDPSLERIVDDIARLAKERLAIEMDNFYLHMDPEVAVEIFEASKHTYSLPISELEKRKLQSYMKGKLSYPAVSEVLYKLVTQFFVRGGGEYSLDAKRILVEKVLKKKRWSKAMKDLRMDEKEFFTLMDSTLLDLARRAVEGED